MNTLFENIATCRELNGNDVRVLLYCYKHDRMQTDIRQALNMKKQNASAHCIKLAKLGLLEVTEAAGSKFYRVNESWDPDVLTEQNPTVII